MPSTRPRPSLRLAHCLAACLACALARPRADAPDTVSLPSARVRAAPPAPAAAKAVLIPDDVDRQLGNLGDLLQRLPGLHVMRAGGVGDYLGVSVWGASDAQVSVYVNGVPQNPAADPSLFLSGWDLARIERVEVYKGLAPDHLPGAPMGGAINIVTREDAPAGASPASLRLAAGAGSFGALKANGSARYARGPWSGRVEAARDQADGDFPYYDDNGLEYKPGRNPDGSGKLGPGDLVRKVRGNNAHGLTDLAADLGYRPAQGFELGLQADASRLDKRIPAPYPGIDSSVRVSADLLTDKASVRGRGRWSAGRAEAAFDLSGSWLRQDYVDTSQGGGAIGIGYDRDRNAYVDGLADAWARLDAGAGVTLSALIAYGGTGYFFTDRLAGRAYPGIFRYTGEGKFNALWTRGRHTLQAVLDARVTLQEQAAARRFGFDGSRLPDEERDAAALPRLGWQYRRDEQRWLSLEAGLSERLPTFLEKYGDRGTVVANPGLKRETAWDGAATAHAEGARGSAELTAFARAQRDLITVEQNAQYVLVYRNTARARILGAEARLAAAPRPWTRSELDLTLQRAENATPGDPLEGKRLPYRPDFQAAVRQVFAWRGWGLAASAYYQGRSYPNAANLPSLFDAYSHDSRWQSRCDLDLSWRSRHLLLAGGVRNLFDQNAFDFFNYPLPGRSFAFTAQAGL
jgi:outer membrane cobalamin receptor